MPAISPADARRGCAVAAQVNRLARIEHDAIVAPLIRQLQAQGMSLRDIGMELAARCIRTRQGGLFWHKKQILRVLRRADAPVTVPDDRALAGETLPATEMSEPVTPAVEMHQMACTNAAHRHDAQHEGAVPQADDGVRDSAETETLPGNGGTPCVQQQGDASRESIAQEVSHLPAWLEREMSHHQR
jgi:hypothetical protein